MKRITLTKGKILAAIMLENPYAGQLAIAHPEWIGDIPKRRVSEKQFRAIASHEYGHVMEQIRRERHARHYSAYWKEIEPGRFE